MPANYDITEWVNQTTDKSQCEFRQAVHTILVAIANDEHLRANMIIKGGILLAIRYHSHRYTKDIDFSTSLNLKELNCEKVTQELNSGLLSTVNSLSYDLDCKVQTCQVNPPNKPDATFPSLNISIGYAYKGTPKHKRLNSGVSPTTIKIDYSLNELMPHIEKLKLGNDDSIRAYALTDLIAEKLRSLLQQPLRNRNRRQDVFDLHLLLTLYPKLGKTEKQKIHDSLVQKSESRNMVVTIDSFDNPEIKERAQAEYQSLADEVEGDLPDFDNIFELVLKFYKSLPWRNNQ
ncbi:hypothetical protein MNBD_GAMMA12-3989 [hydrothermal vent metagenome]|uniref:Nucleotidyl transferase AbiEii/AbiGii toxin family protein n=1 Tax=hydrothermal vent metagenome TaxID=652676 RepID=A0A3B0Z052_9ZZZZ